MGAEDIRTLLRAYAALTLAHHAAERYAGSAPPHPYLLTVANNHSLAIRELERLLEGALSGIIGPPVLRGPEEECATMLM